MFEGLMKFFKKMGKKEEKTPNSKVAAKERLHLVLMQDRANVSADFLELMKQEIIEVIKKYIEVDENSIDVRLTNKENDDGTNGAPALYANIPIINIKNEARKLDKLENKEENKDVKEAKINEKQAQMEEKSQVDKVEVSKEKEKQKEDKTKVVEESKLNNKENKDKEHGKNKIENGYNVKTEKMIKKEEKNINNKENKEEETKINKKN